MVHCRHFEIEEHEKATRRFSVDTIIFQELVDHNKLDSYNNPRTPLLYDKSHKIIMEHECPNVVTGLKFINFLIMTTMFTMSIFLDFCFSLAYKPLGIYYGYGDIFLSFVGSFYSIKCVDLMDYSGGYTFERHTFRVLVTFITAGMCFFTGTLLWMGPLSHATFFNCIYIQILYLLVEIILYILPHMLGYLGLN